MNLQPISTGRIPWNNYEVILKTLSRIIHLFSITNLFWGTTSKRVDWLPDHLKPLGSHPTSFRTDRWELTLDWLSSFPHSVNVEFPSETHRVTASQFLRKRLMSQSFQNVNPKNRWRPTKRSQSVKLQSPPSDRTKVGCSSSTSRSWISRHQERFNSLNACKNGPNAKSCEAKRQQVHASSGASASHPNTSRKRTLPQKRVLMGQYFWSILGQRKVSSQGQACLIRLGHVMASLSPSLA